MGWKSIGIIYWVRYIHIELIDYGTSCYETEIPIDNNKLIEKNNVIILSNYPNNEQISEFVIKCTSTADEYLLPNLFDWKSDSSWISENSKGVVRVKQFNCSVIPSYYYFYFV